MIRVVFAASRPTPELLRLQFSAQGHAGQAPRGRDIVCAAASILAEALAAAAEELAAPDGPAVFRETGEGSFRLEVLCPRAQQQPMRERFATARAGYRLLAQFYPDCVALEER